MAARRPGTGGPWGTGLLLLGLGVTVYGAAYITARTGDLSPSLASLAELIPPALWGVAWIAVGLWCAWWALQPARQRAWHILPLVGVFALWAAAHASYWLVVGLLDGEWTRQWVSAVGWALLAGMAASWGRCINPPQAR